MARPRSPADAAARFGWSGLRGHNAARPRTSGKRHARRRTFPRARTAGRRDIADLMERGSPFVEAVEATRMPMVVTDARRPGNPVIYANPAFLRMLGRGPD